MEKFLIALDLDGTLLNNQSQLSNYTISTIKKLKDLGHVLVIATGRPYHACIDFYYQLNLDTPLISDNGGSIRLPDDENFVPVIKRIELDVAHELFKKSKPFLVSAFFSEGDVSYSYQDTSILRKIFKENSKEVIHTDFDQLDIAPTGAIYLVSTQYKDEFENLISNEFKGRLQYRFWGSDSKHAIYEFYVPGISKASALDYVAKLYGIKSDHIMAFGDGANDLEMLSFATYGVVMKNAFPDVIGHTSFVSEFDNDDDGVAKYLSIFFNIK